MNRRKFLGGLGALVSLSLLRKIPKGEVAGPKMKPRMIPSGYPDGRYDKVLMWQKELARVMREAKDKEIAKLFMGRK